MARDYKGFGNQAMNAVVEKSRGGADGIMVGKSPSFQRGPLKDVSRAIGNYTIFGDICPSIGNA